MTTEANGPAPTKPQFEGWVGDGHTTRRMRWGEFVYEDRSAGSRYGSKPVTFRRIEGEWPSNEALITLADGDDPAHPHHFGGTVNGFGEERHIVVYTD